MPDTKPARDCYYRLYVTRYFFISDPRFPDQGPRHRRSSPYVESGPIQTPSDLLLDFRGLAGLTSLINLNRSWETRIFALPTQPIWYTLRALGPVDKIAFFWKDLSFHLLI